MFEHIKQPLIPRKIFLSRLFKNFLITLIVLLTSLLIGTFGYKYFAGLSWIDAFYNASMILTGMGPAADLKDNNTAKVFASFYALFSGVAFLTSIAILIAPVLHRFLHKLHLDSRDDDEKE
ncbi:MAG: hypothetical protein ACRDFC_09955 [Ignavibacteria bacterium]